MEKRNQLIEGFLQPNLGNVFKINGALVNLKLRNPSIASAAKPVNVPGNSPQCIISLITYKLQFFPLSSEISQPVLPIART